MNSAFCLKKAKPQLITVSSVILSRTSADETAVVRNRARRVIREAFRIFDHDLRELTDKRYDFIFVARTKTASLKSTQALGLMKSRLLPLVAPLPKNKDKGL